MQEEKRLQAYPALKVLIPFLLGLVFSVGIDRDSCFVPVTVIFVAASLMLVFLGFKHQTGRSVSWWNLCFLTVWISLGFIRGNMMQEKTDINYPDSAAYYQAVLISQPYEAGKTLRAEACLLRYYNCDSVWSVRDKILVSFLKDSVSADLSLGDAVAFYAPVRRVISLGNPYEFDYAAYLRRQGICGQTMLFRQNWNKLSVTDTIYRNLQASLSSEQHIRLFFLKLRQKLLSDLRQKGLEGEAFAVYAALAVGEKSYLSSDIEQLYSNTGTSHVLALSGMHLGILMFFFYFIFSHGLKYSFWRWPFFFLACILIWSYTFMAGLPISLVRAATMYVFSLFGMMIHRRHFSLNILFWTAFLMLFAAPESMYDVGFQLSFAAMLGILLFQNKIEALIPVRVPVIRSLWSGMSVSLAAQITTAPLVILYFHYLPMTGIWATMLVSLTAMGLLYSLPLYLLFGGYHVISSLIVTGVTWLVSLQHAILQWFETWPFSRFGPFYITWLELLACYLFISAFTLLSGRRHKLAVMLMSVCSFAFFAAGRIRHHAIKNDFPMMIFYNNYRSPAVHIIYDARRSYLIQPYAKLCKSDFAYIRQSFWNRYTNQFPRVLSTGFYEDSLICNGAGLVYTPYFQLGILHAGIPLRQKWKDIDTLDYLYLCRGFKGDLAEFLDGVRPGLVILDRSLTDYEHKRYVHFCRTNRLPYHDMRVSGALKVALY